MKKVLLSAVAASFLLASCGPDVCDCVSSMNEMGEKMKDAKDEDAMKAIEAEYKDKLDACKKLGEGKSDEEKEKMAEAAKECK